VGDWPPDIISPDPEFSDATACWQYIKLIKAKKSAVQKTKALGCLGNRTNIGPPPDIVCHLFL
jgi:hypothetical protein